MMSAAEIDPLRVRDQESEFLLESLQRPFERIGVLFAEIVDMQTGDAFRTFSAEGRGLDPEPGFRGAGVVDRHRAFGMFRIAPDAETDVFCSRGQGAEPLPLRQGIEDHMIAEGQEFAQIGFGISGSESGDLLAEFLAPQPGLVRRTGAGAVQDLGQQRVDRIHGKGLLGEQDLDARTFPHGIEDRQIFPQESLVHHETGRFDPVQQSFDHLNSSTQGRPY